MVDAFYVPGVLAHAFGYLSMVSVRHVVIGPTLPRCSLPSYRGTALGMAYVPVRAMLPTTNTCVRYPQFQVPLSFLRHSQTSYYANAEVELATSTIYDTVALRSEREHLRNVFDGKHALTKYDPLLHDWAHSFKYSKPEPRERARAVAARAAADGWFYRPNITALRLRPFVYEHS